MLRTAMILVVITSASISSAQDFIRADLDGDGRGGTISDARMFGYSSGPGPFDCSYAWDANDDGGVNLGDQIFMLGFISPADPDALPLPTIPAPGPFTCGPDLTPDNNTFLDCASYNACGGWTPPPVSPDRTLSIESGFGAVGGTVTLEVLLDVDSPVTEPGVGAYCFGIAHDPAIATVADVRLGSAYATEEPDFFWHEVSAAGVTITMLYEFIETAEVHGLGLAIHEVDYLLVGAGTTALSFQGELGVNPSPMMIVDARFPMFREAWTPTTIDGTLTAEVLPFFLRGDANDDGFFDIADPITLLFALFAAGFAPACPDALDVNDDGLINVADGVYSLSALFTGGPLPTFPGPNTCGWDPTLDMQPGPCDSSSCP